VGSVKDFGGDTEDHSKTEEPVTAAVRDRFNINKFPSSGQLDYGILMDDDLVQKVE
jgi:hypothetical protein